VQIRGRFVKMVLSSTIFVTYQAKNQPLTKLN
jgi:hypothetical protein